MKLARLSHQPSRLIEFFQQGMERLGAVCERSWHDRLHLIAEGSAAQVCRRQDDWVETELRFVPPEETTPRNADTEVFPGCPLTFRLAEALRPKALELNRVPITLLENPKPPAPDVLEKLWRTQWPETHRWKQQSPFVADWHFSLLSMVRCELQAIEQHWSLHRLVFSLADGQPDPALAQNLEFAQSQSHGPGSLDWPKPDPNTWHQWLNRALEQELTADLARLRERQEKHLRRELDRIDSYFANYEKELTDRLQRQHRDNTKQRTEQRLEAAKTEHQRRRQDQIQRHEIRVIPHVDTLFLLAEPAWKTTVSTSSRSKDESHHARFIPRTRRWIVT